MFKDVCEDLVSFDLKNKKWNLDIKEWKELIARMVHRTIQLQARPQTTSTVTLMRFF